jgi:hypothetical protein
VNLVSLLWCATATFLKKLAVHINFHIEVIEKRRKGRQPGQEEESNESSKKKSSIFGS